MPRWFWILLSVLISTLVYFTIRYGLNPKPIPVMNLTQFDNEEQIGAVLYRRLRQNIRQERLVVLGSSADLANVHDLWTGFLKTAAADQLKIDVFYQRQGPQAVPAEGAMEMAYFDQAMFESGKLVEEIKSRLQRGHLVLVQLTTPEASHLVKESFSKKMDRELKQPVLAISTLPLAIGAKEEEGLQALCLDASRDETGLFRLSCAAQKAAKKVERKKPDPTKTWAVIESHGFKEFLIFVHRP
jgi:hypothetical protein